jgi:hypothetical protein
VVTCRSDYAANNSYMPHEEFTEERVCPKEPLLPNHHRFSGVKMNACINAIRTAPCDAGTIDPVECRDICTD